MVQKSFIYVYQNDYKWYLVPRKPRLNISIEKLNLLQNIMAINNCIVLLRRYFWPRWYVFMLKTRSTHISRKRKHALTRPAGFQIVPGTWNIGWREIGWYTDFWMIQTLASNITDAHPLTAPTHPHCCTCPVPTHQRLHLGCICGFGYLKPEYAREKKCQIHHLYDIFKACSNSMFLASNHT